MRVETTGLVKMKDDPGRGTPVSVVLDGDRLSIDLIGEWSQSELGITSLNEGFAIRAEGEEIVLVTDDDAALAEGLGMATLNPRLARKIAASHPPEDRPLEIPESSPEEPGPSYLPIIGIALAGALMVVGGFMLRSIDGADARALDAASTFWLAFVVGGLLMGGVAFLAAIGKRWSQWAGIAVLAAMVYFLIQAGRDASFDSGQLMAYGFVAGGIVVGVAVVFGGSVAADR